MSDNVEIFKSWPGKWETENSIRKAVHKNEKWAFEIITFWSKEMGTRGNERLLFVFVFEQRNGIPFPRESTVGEVF